MGGPIGCAVSCGRRTTDWYVVRTEARIFYAQLLQCRELVDEKGGGSGCSDACPANLGKKSLKISSTVKLEFHLIFVYSTFS